MRKIISLILGIILMASVLSVSAEETSVSLSYDAESRVVTVSGKAYGEVIVTVPPIGISPSSLNLTDKKFIYMRQFYADGDYTLKVVMPENAVSGKYTVYVSNMTGEAQDEFSFMNIKNAQIVLPLINNAESVNELMQITEANALDFGVDLSDAAYVENKERIYSLLISMKSDCQKATEFNSEFFKAYALCLLENSSEAQVEQILSKYALQLGIDFQNDYVNEKRLTDDALKCLKGILASTDYKDLFSSNEDTDFTGFFEESKKVAAISSALTWKDIKQVLTVDFEENFEYLYENSLYKKLNSPDKIYSHMMGYEYNAYKSIEEGFEKAVKQQYEAENRPNNIGGGHGGGSGNSGGGSVSVPTDLPDESDVELKSSDFSDITLDFWGYNAIALLKEKGIANGYEDGTFRPSNVITRAEFAKLVCGIDKILSPNGNVNEAVSFYDVNEQDWFYSYINEAARKGLVSGNNNFFTPLGNITREDAALIVWRTIKRAGKELSGFYMYTDRADISDYARDAVSALGSELIVKGMGDNSFKPKNNLTRAEAMQMLHNVLLYMEVE